MPLLGVYPVPLGLQPAVESWLPEVLPMRGMGGRKVKMGKGFTLRWTPVSFCTLAQCTMHPHRWSLHQPHVACLQAPAGLWSSPFSFCIPVLEVEASCRH